MKIYFPKSTVSGLPSTTDIVFVDTLRVSANLGRDCWGRERAQPVEVSVYLHLTPSYLQAAGESDDVLDSVHYGDLTKAISRTISEKSESDSPAFDGPDGLISAVAECAFELAGDAVAAVRVVLDVPKMILLATGYSVDVRTAKGSPNAVASKKVMIKEIVIPVIIGVNAPEREAKQRVVVNITFYENIGSGPSVQYQEIIAQLCEKIETSSYLTLEKFVMQIVKFSCLSSEKIAAVTVCAQKPSALSFAQSSGVEITRKRETFLPAE